MAHVFISYKSENRDFALELAQRLDGADLACWMADRMQGGKKWRDELDNKIWESFALVLVITPDAMKSEVVNYEWIFALGAKVEVIPVYLQTIEHFPYRLGDIQYIDFRERCKWKELISRLKDIEKGAEDEKDREPAFIRQAIGRLDDLDLSIRQKSINDLALSDHPAGRAAIADAAVHHHLRDVRVNAAFKLAEITGHTDKRALPGLADSAFDTKAA